MATSFYSEEELQQMGFAHVGHDVMISRKASIYGASNIWIGNHVRVDDFCVLSGKITFGNYIHVAVTTTLFGGTAGITFEDYTGISSHCAVYAASDDYSGDFMTNPTVPEKFTNVIEEPVVIKKYRSWLHHSAGCYDCGGMCTLCDDVGDEGYEAVGNLSGIPVHPHQGAKPEDAGTGYIGTGSRLGFHQFQ